MHRTLILVDTVPGRQPLGGAVQEGLTQAAVQLGRVRVMVPQQHAGAELSAYHRMTASPAWDSMCDGS